MTSTVHMVGAEYLLSPQPRDQATYLLALTVCSVLLWSFIVILNVQTKYVLGSGDLLLTPAVVCLLDPEIRQGVASLFRRKRERPGTGYLR